MNLKRRMRRILTFPLVILVGLYIIFEEFLQNFVKPVIDRISAWHILQRMECFLQNRHPYTLFAIYVGKLGTFGSIKLFALYLISHGYPKGVYLLVGGETFGAMITVWYARVALPILQTLPWFAKGYSKVIGLKNRIVNTVKSTAAFQLAKIKVQQARLRFSAVKERIKTWYRLRKGRVSMPKAVYKFMHRKQ